MELFILFFISYFVFTIFVCGLSKNPYRPNGYSPRGGWHKPNRGYVNGATHYKHGQEVYITSLVDFLEGKNNYKVQYYNEHTDEFEDAKPID